jgi:hypothetical protein
MTDQQIRLECLRQAVTLTNKSTASGMTETALRTAQQFYDFCHAPPTVRSARDICEEITRAAHRHT